jgi:hypothetical protein
LVAAWARLGDADELTRICHDVLTRRRPRQGYAVAVAAQHIIAAHVDHWRLDVPVEADGGRKNRALLKSGPKVARRLNRALSDLIQLHRKAQDRRWYGKKIVGGLMTPRRPRQPDGSFASRARRGRVFPSSMSRR